MTEFDAPALSRRFDALGQYLGKVETLEACLTDIPEYECERTVRVNINHSLYGALTLVEHPGCSEEKKVVRAKIIANSERLKELYLEAGYEDEHDELCAFLIMNGLDEDLAQQRRAGFSVVGGTEHNSQDPS